MNWRVPTIAAFILAAGTLAIWPAGGQTRSNTPANGFVVACERAYVCSPRDIAALGHAARRADQGDPEALAYMAAFDARMGVR